MNFTTSISVKKTKNPIDYQSQTILLGSCFSENIGEKFEYFKFQTTVNPFGIIFNVVSIEKLVRRIVKKNYFTESDIFFHNDLWHCFEVHSELSNPNKETFLENLNQLIESTNQQINKSTHIITTLGTSWVYRHNESSQIVANCHKVPQKVFTKELLSVEENEQSLLNIVALIQSINTNCKFIFTVSPVRHIKDGFFENNVSKAHLHSAINKLLNIEECNQNIEYFPSYEIMMDELRDYRFYAEDMLHPNQTAVDYIWIKFSEKFIAESEFETMKQVSDIQKAFSHRPFNPNTESHQNFLKKLDDKILLLKQKLPSVNFT
jgi:GSCFA family